MQTNKTLIISIVVSTVVICGFRFFFAGVFRRLPGMTIPMQVIEKTGSVSWQEDDLSGMDEQALLIEAFFQASFHHIDFERGPFLHIHLIRRAKDDYVMIYTRESRHLKQKTMKYFEAHLPPEEFVRIHRSYIVRVEEIAQMQLYEKDSYIVILKNGTKLPVSKTGLPKLKKQLDF